MTNQVMVIRPFDEATDTKKLSSIWLEASRIAHPFIGEQRLLEQRSLIEDKYLPAAETWVALIDDEPAGFISLMDTFIGAIFVAPALQGRGIGQRLIAHARDHKRDLSLEVYTRNQQAVRFYTALGFEEVSRRPADDEGLPYENALLRLRK